MKIQDYKLDLFKKCQKLLSEKMEYCKMCSTSYRETEFEIEIKELQCNFDVFNVNIFGEDIDNVRRTVTNILAYYGMKCTSTLLTHYDDDNVPFQQDLRFTIKFVPDKFDAYDDIQLDFEKIFESSDMCFGIVNWILFFIKRRDEQKKKK